MKKEDIVAGNKIIAEFIGYTYYGHNTTTNDAGWKRKDTPIGKSITEEVGKRNYLCRRHDGLRFDNSWDWLLPAYKKLGTELEKLSNDIKSYKGCSWVSKQATLQHIDDCDSAIRCEIWGVRIIDAFYGIVETIKWYNKNKNKEWLKDK